MSLDARQKYLLGLLVTVLLLAHLAILLVYTQPAYGTLSGRIVAEDTGMPLPKAQLIISGDKVGVDSDGRFTRRLTAGQHTVTVTTRAHALKPIRVNLREGSHEQLDLQLKPLPPQLEVIVHQHVYPSNKPAEVSVKGFVGQQALQVSLYRTDVERLALQERGNLANLIGPEYGYTRKLQGPLGPAFSFVSGQAFPITTRDAEGLFYERLQLALPEPGVYLVSVEADGLRQFEWVMQTTIALVTKSDGRRTVAFVTDFSTGQPVPGAEVNVYRKSQRVGSGLTGASGLYTVDLPPSEDSSELAIIAASGSSRAFVMPWVYSSDSRPSKLFFQTDRPVYRPGHTVQFKCLVRQWEGERYVVPGGEPMDIEVRDPQNSVVYRKSLRLSRGSLWDAIPLNEEAPTGEYSVTCRLAGREYDNYFVVASYRKPEYEVKLLTEREQYVRGDRVQVDLQANYYFGSPVPGARVEYTVYKSPYWYYPPDEEDFFGGMEDEMFESEGASGVVVDEGTTRTDAAGHALIKLDTSDGDDRDEYQEDDHQYWVSVAVRDQSDRTVSVDKRIIVTRGDFRIMLEPNTWLATPGRPVTVEAKTVDYDGNAVAVTLEGGIARETWAEEERQLKGEQLVPAQTTSPGLSTFTVTPPAAGDYVVFARGVDQRGNHIRESLSLWVTDEAGGYEGEAQDSLQLVLDQKSYRIGDRARVLVTSGKPAAAALVTVETDTLLYEQVVALRENSAMVDLPVLETYSPNVYVNACAVSNGKMSTAQKSLNVGDERRALKVKVTSDKAAYAPGEQVNVTVQAVPKQGQVAPAEIALAVVDEAIFAIREDDTPDMLSFFYPRRENSVTTDYSFPQIYLSADKTANVKDLRQKFPDTALWLPRLMTDQNGLARTSFRMPDTLTTWRLTARAATADTAVGSQTAKVLCQKPLSLRLELPRFVTQGDRVRVAAIVHNETGQRQKVVLAVQPTGLRLRGKLSRTITVGDEPERVEWWAEVGEPIGPATVSATVQSGQYQDGVKLTIPTYAYGRKKSDHLAGVLREQETVEVALDVRQDIVGQPKVLLRLSPSLISTAFGALQYYAEYPYGCVEQTTSAMLCDLAVLQALPRSGNGSVTDKTLSELPKMVKSGLQRLYNMQQSGGGWGWWRYDGQDVWMTAYALQGLLAAQQAGFGVNQQLLESGMNTLIDATAPQPMEHPDHLALAAYVLAQGNHGEQARQLLMRLRMRQLSTYALALHVRTLLALGDQAMAGTFLSDLLARGKESPTAFWYESGDYDRNAIEITALATLALLEVSPDDERADKAMRWLAASRRGDGWMSTRDTIAVVSAIGRYLQAHPLPTQPFDVSVQLNSEPAQQVHFTPEDALQPEKLIVLMGKLQPGKNAIKLTRNGEGEVWYSAELRQVLGGDNMQVPETGAAMRVSRSWHRLSPQRDRQSGETTIEPEGEARQSFRLGDLVQVQVRVEADQSYVHLVLEDPVPAGFEVMEQTEIAVDEWDYEWADMDVRDERISFFIEELSQGTHVYTYHLRAQASGRCSALPSLIYSMYLPDLRAGGLPGRLTVGR